MPTKRRLLILLALMVLVLSSYAWAFSEDSILSTLSSPSNPTTPTTTTTGSINVNTNDQATAKRDVSSAAVEKYEKTPDMEIFEKAYEKCISECSQVVDVCRKACNLLKLRQDNRLTSKCTTDR